MPLIRLLVSLTTVIATLILAPATMAAGEHASAPAKRTMAPKAALAVGATFDSRGRLWRVRPGADGVWVDYSDDLGRTFGAAVRASPEVPAADGELAPEIAVARDGTVHIAYTLPGATNPIVGHIRSTRSTDGGRSFGPADTVNDNRDEITHRFQSMVVDERGAVHLVWIDKRDLEAAKRRGQAYAGAAIYSARAADGRFGANAKVADHSCECCRIASALDTDGVPVAFWRHVFDDGSRDHALARLDGSAAARVTHEGWRINACPHHGPAIAIGPDRTRHLAWFTAEQGEGRVLYQAQDLAGRAAAPPRRLGGDQASYPALLAAGDNVVLAWKDFDGRATRIYAEHSTDGGRTWSAPQTLASSIGPSDRPRLVSHAGQAYLSWNTRDDGYRLIPVKAAP